MIGAYLLVYLVTQGGPKN